MTDMILKDIIAFDDAVHITDALSKSKTLHKKLSRLEYTDAAVDNLIVKQALEKLENARKKLADKLEAYGKPAGEEQTEKLGFFDKVDSWISSLIQCPVDFTVYDESGNEVGYVRN